MFYVFNLGLFPLYVKVVLLEKKVCNKVINVSVHSKNTFDFFLYRDQDLPNFMNSFFQFIKIVFNSFSTSVLLASLLSSFFLLL